MRRAGFMTKIEVGYGKRETSLAERYVDLSCPDDADWSGVSSILAPGVVQHWTTEEAATRLREWAALLPPGGELVVTAVDSIKVAASLAERRGDIDYERTLLGKPGGMPVVSLWDASGLVSLLRTNGFPYVEQMVGDDGYTLVFRGTTATGVSAEGSRIDGIVGVMSRPRLGFTAQADTMAQIAADTGMNFITNDSVFWGQGLSVCFKMAMEQGAKYILTMDYDTYAKPRHVRELIRLAELSGADAIAPGQMRRGKTALLAYMTQENGQKFFDGEPLVPAETAHFGLTLLRVSALEKMPKPWFWAKPNADGEWGDGKIDEDIVFWQQWKEVGNSLYIASQVCIGHCEQVVSMLGYNGEKVLVEFHELDKAHTKARF